nr:hypothetical protein Iba_chr13bCG11040 [Ipomoea batatas]
MSSSHYLSHLNTPSPQRFSDELDLLERSTKKLKFDDGTSGSGLMLVMEGSSEVAIMGVPAPVEVDVVAGTSSTDPLASGMQVEFNGASHQTSVAICEPKETTSAMDVNVPPRSYIDLVVDNRFISRNYPRTARIYFKNLFKNLLQKMKQKLTTAVDGVALQLGEEDEETKAMACPLAWCSNGDKRRMALPPGEDDEEMTIL